jgi:hydrogenase-1 operon protein HyaE
MSSPLIQDLIENRGYPVVDAETVDDFLQTHENALLFFTENPQQFPESNDVAVVLPELMKQFGDRLSLAVVDRKDERAMHARYPFEGWPALVHLRNGQYVGAISRMQDWDVYLQALESLLQQTPSTLKPIRVNVVSEQPGGCHH